MRILLTRLESFIELKWSYLKMRSIDNGDGRAALNPVTLYEKNGF